MKFEDKHIDDERLDELLKKYGEAEPRTGLEGRILASLAAERGRCTAPGWRWQLMVAVVAFGIAAGIGLFVVRTTRKPSVIEVRETSNANAGAIKQSAMSSRKPEIQATQTYRRKPQKKESHPLAEPRLEQFPSPAPLNEQEELLARYVSERPREAVLVAKARAELLKQDLARFLEPPSSEQVEDLQ
jgi:hypothetical protein